MARISLYIPDDLKERMDAASAEVNFSDVARPALTAAVAAFEHRKEGTMSTAIARLRASKQQADQGEKVQGEADGRTWAENTAEYRWLRDLSRRKTNFPMESPDHAFSCVFDPLDDAQPGELSSKLFGIEIWPSDEYMEAFIDGALEFFEEVREEVERD